LSVRIKFSGILELLPVFQDNKEIQIDFSGDTLKDLLNQLFLKIVPACKKIAIFNDPGKISSNLLVSVNGRIVSDSNQRLGENDYIELNLSSGG